MKNNVLLFNMLLMLSLFPCYAKAMELFYEANQHYAQGDYQQAVQLYHRIAEKKGAVWFNMGNAYASLGKPIEALAYWRRAQQVGNQQIMQQAEKLIAEYQQKNGLMESTSWVESPQVFLETISLFFPPLLWQFFMILAFVFFCSGIWYLMMNRRLFLFCSSLFIVFFITTLCAFRVQFSAKDCAFVLEDTAAYVGPHEKLDVVYCVKSAQEVIILHETDTWFKVKCKSGLGWIPSRAVIRVQTLS